MKVQRLFIYPVKSLRPVEVTAAEVTNEGLRFDRQYILTKPPCDASNGLAEHITIKSHFKLGLFLTTIDKSWSKLTITHRLATEDASLVIPLTPSPLSLLRSPIHQVSIFGTRAPGIDMGDEASSYFTKHLAFEVRLLYIGGTGRREIPGAQHVFRHYRAISAGTMDKLQPQRLRFADAAPILVTTTASEQDARERLPKAYQGEDVIIRFRPNIHVAVDDDIRPYDEDFWNLLTVKSQNDHAQEVSVRCLFRTVRCLSLNADLETGGMIAASRQLYGLLARDRRVNDRFPNKPVFGQYACAGPSGAILRVGDDVEITTRNSTPNSPLDASSLGPG